MEEKLYNRDDMVRGYTIEYHPRDLFRVAVAITTAASIPIPQVD
jgi:hypothetical protein